MILVEFPIISLGFFWDKILRQNKYPRTKISIRENSGYDFHFYFQAYRKHALLLLFLML